jgi:hypothetical protein
MFRCKIVSEGSEEMHEMVINIDAEVREGGEVEAATLRQIRTRSGEAGQTRSPRSAAPGRHFYS